MGLPIHAGYVLMSDGFDRVANEAFHRAVAVRVSLVGKTALLHTESTALSAADLVAQAGTVKTSFDRSLISGNISWLVDTTDGRFFCKSAGSSATPPSASVPVVDYPDRVELLRNAAAVARSCDHPALAPLRAVIKTCTGPLLVYDAAPGELVYSPPSQRSDPSSSYRRFASQPAKVRLCVFDQLLDLHAALGNCGWVASDLYDGCMLVDGHQLTVIDVDSYRRGAFVSTTNPEPKYQINGLPVPTGATRHSGRQSTYRPQCSTSAD